uniref:alcohol dehydrogenase n=1 Tax=Polytomella sp. Pringsheim 198.80 TaxID=37502 RepID=A0A7U3JZJ1_9CHLO|nr:aldehyde/alcohol dehydrogenase 1 [Polytomella sp. Pringsheim 198.80]|mmetsp:Transcript_15654/g.28004  ORF Transcript_15654/g.28004 Transcript_15654/m.28004 type:complete len:991 (-) Transcript_15654:1705-4677(-)|eukprot:CAMPEP_0175049196 /NCGR_PEP_ID=MMETSP0052_2-20121109/6605_1 /TAXON_ID=51329 ORGANISM="Polytomella parva, Strain SAG 63-3" /NCGR_SAMPLE_ID=MMETSP0052_2 /ASSEMBLY_ACC=CAM_ASM_000194 /LENGTH=990 /DNA_ID=CAMNT_0016313333 /DNA_START=191 /DNA_END=3163 /DNA_ORIENTATION=-
MLTSNITGTSITASSRSKAFLAPFPIKSRPCVPSGVKKQENIRKGTIVAKATPASAKEGDKKGKIRAPIKDEELTILHETLKKAKHAQHIYGKFSQEQVDHVFRCAAEAANAARLPLAKMAVAETRMGVVEDKVIKNHFASEFVYNKYKSTKTCGVIEHNENGGVTKVAEPVGVIAGIVPTTNPTSTAIFKALLALKTRNGLILCPHPRAAKCTVQAAKIIHDAAVAAGAPEGIISWVASPSMVVSQALMQAPEISLILATGGPGMVRAAYSSGHPSLGVGAGNTPALIDETADIEMAVSSILISKTFDNGVICASEQSIVVVDSIYDEVRAEFVKRGAHFLDEAQKEKVRGGILKDGHLNADIVGQSISRLTEIFGISVPAGSKVLIGEIERIGKDEPFSQEKLSPILGMYRAKDYDDALQKTYKLIMNGGAGHTSVLYSSPLNKENIGRFQDMAKTVRVLINTPASQGAIGDLYNSHLNPSLTLGCGSWGSTSVSTNVGPEHLLNVKHVHGRREGMLWFRVPPKVYFKSGCLEPALMDLKGKRRAFIITDKPLFDLKYAERICGILDSINVHSHVFYHVTPDPTLACIDAGLKEMRAFNPDVIIALGGGSPMDAAKVMWLMYECPETRFDGLAMRFMDITKRIYSVPELGRKAILVAIPTTSGTGSEVTPFSVVTNEVTGQKYPIADYALTPSMAIIDPQLVLTMPKRLTAWSGIDALTHALESYVSVCSSDYNRGLAKEAISLLFKYLPRSFKKGGNDVRARAKVHYAATIAGMSFANAFLGICHSMAHKLGAAYHVPHGLANAALISHVIRYNATDAPFKQAAHPQYRWPRAKNDYAQIADVLGLGGSPGAMTDDEKVIKLIEAIEELKRELEIPATLKDIFNDPAKDAEFLANIDHLAEEAFDDQCTGANPRYPLINDLKQILLDAHSVPITPLKSLSFGGSTVGYDIPPPSPSVSTSSSSSSSSTQVAEPATLSTAGNVVTPIA